VVVIHHFEGVDVRTTKEYQAQLEHERGIASCIATVW
jgi:hypothetical protein